MFRRTRRPPVPDPPPAAPPLNPEEVAVLGVDLAVLLYRSMVDGTTASLTATLRLDEQGRVSAIDGPAVDGEPRLPPMEVVEQLNQLSTQLASLPEDRRPASFTIQVVDGQVDAEIGYR